MRLLSFLLGISRLFQPKIISILLAALVVLCPFQCIFGGCLANGLGEATVSSTSCCTHCSQPADDGEHESSVPSGCDCGDCFCRGALPVNDISDDFVVAELASFMTFWVKLETAQIELPSVQQLRYSSTLPIAATPLEVRAALCCWVI